MTWHDAKQKCEDLGGHLAIIASKEEDNFVLSLARKEDLAEIYLGATDEQKEGRWIWVSGQTMTYSHWGPQQPSNHFGTEHYLTLRLQSKHNGCWNDLPDVFQEYKIGFVCQWD